MLYTEGLKPLSDIWQGNDSQPLNGLTFTDVHNGWAVGPNGVILRTRDGGHSWALQLRSGKAAFVKAAFTGPDTGYVVGQQGIILHTSDGGTNWLSIVDPKIQTVKRGILRWVEPPCENTILRPLRPNSSRNCSERISR